MGCNSSTPTSPQSAVDDTAQQEKREFIFKTMLLGDSGVGKSCLLLQYTDGSFTEEHKETVGIDFKVKTFELDGKTIKLQMWDTAGQERFRNIIRSYYNGVQGIMVLYDVTNKESFDNLKNWFADIKEHANKDVAKILIGNKCDETECRVVDYTTAKEFADNVGVPFMEMSAKSNTNVEQAFIMLAADLLRIASLK